MRITQTRDAIEIQGYPTPFGERDISIRRQLDSKTLEYNADGVGYADRFGYPIVEFFDENGLYDCESNKLQEGAWLYERIVFIPKRMDLCHFCKHAKTSNPTKIAFWNQYISCKLSALETNIKYSRSDIVDCDQYERWDE
jgi:hypothetical protein